MLPELLQLMRKRRDYYRRVFEFDEDLYPVINLSTSFVFLFVLLASLPFWHTARMGCSLSTSALILHVGGIMCLHITLSRFRVWCEAVYNPDWWRELQELDRQVTTLICQLSVEDFLTQTNGRELLLDLLRYQEYRCFFAHYYTLWTQSPRQTKLLRELSRWRFLYSPRPQGG